MTFVLGGGISGLSAAYYALDNPKLGKIALLEASNRLGGWIQSQVLDDGTVFEKGPRTIRCYGPAGQNTLNLMQHLNLEKKIVSVNSAHTAVKNRMIYTKNHLCRLPNSLVSLFKINPPFNRPLISALWNDLKSPKVVKDDESIYSFVERRLGKDIADYIISPMMCGIYAGDAQKISVKAIMNALFEAEQSHGSITKGLLINNFFKSKEKDVKDNVSELSDLALKAKKERWAIWSLEGGLEQLPCILVKNLQSRGVDIQTESKCEILSFKEDHVEVIVNGEVRKSSRVISSLPAKSLAFLLSKEHPQLAAELNEIPTVTVAVVNLQYPKITLPMEGFGFLVPPKEELPILGAIFDSCIISKPSSTVLTVMMGGAWFEKYFGTSPSKEQLLTVAVRHMTNILNINKDPRAFSVSILENCIPQYIIGHCERLRRIGDYISAHKLPLTLCGSSYRGVGLNDVILSAKDAVSQIV